MLEFKDTETSRDAKSYVYYKGVQLFTIRFCNDSKRYWVCTHNSFINFMYFALKSDESLDFIEPHKYSKSLDGAKNNCKKIFYSYINWLTEK